MGSLRVCPGMGPGQCSGSGDARLGLMGAVRRGWGKCSPGAAGVRGREGSLKQCPGRLGLHRCRACPFLPALSHTRLPQLDSRPRTEPTERKGRFSGRSLREGRGQRLSFYRGANSSKGLQLSPIPCPGWCAARGICPQRVVIRGRAARRT